ncbi:MAG: hypothetical protein EHM20_00235 [Alphaproteobacteria bacterium]|nr:MAG: hypothetical protein EHM20_00235 [Alphaproteobacteria bacterium]
MMIDYEKLDYLKHHVENYLEQIKDIRFKYSFDLETAVNVLFDREYKYTLVELKRNVKNCIDEMIKIYNEFDKYTKGYTREGEKNNEQKRP